MNLVEVVAVTHRGRERTHNEDTVAVAGFQSSALEGRPVRLTVDTVRPVTCLVADGLGGHAQGERASRLAAAVVTDAAPGFHDADAVTAAVHAANDAIYAEMAHTPRWAGMGSTVVLLVLAGAEAICVNVGDSRCYLHRDDVLVQLSADDSPPPAAGSAAATSVLTQTLGGRSAPAAVAPHVHRTEVRDGDRFLLCSDGLSAVVPADRIEAELSKAGNGTAAAEALLRAALDAGGPDNISIAVVDLP
ncbi:PP2C family protein-serine/threonine phosphatase [Dactylosporangium sp. NPDC051541]|uniref:PP2C family protein-serine/threonine phosphatase n=1 Tax=Dactylosporangium sp. NPDC051541 TaxID=3363977 RepID=UPI00379288E2